uniref:Integrase catalytic domain-containing protein n=1 Tax=Trichogramma kaykai TaxID=54128 RepID=A0ABD2WQP3_9HYME
MAPLPASRVTPGRPFATTGLDYAGPLPVLFSKGRGAKSTKGYVAIFVCMVVRAVYVEIVSDLTTEAFLAAYARFCARRGRPHTLCSDNGTTFKGASAELNNLFAEASAFSNEIGRRLTMEGTRGSWLMIQPGELASGDVADYREISLSTSHRKRPGASTGRSHSWHAGASQAAATAPGRDSGESSRIQTIE